MGSGERPGGGGPGVSFLVLMLTTRCNLSCAYCYAAGAARPGDMPPALAQEALEGFHRPGRRLTVELAGGEPLLRFELLAQLVRSWASRPEVRFAVQTNALLLDRERLELLREFGVGLGISLDGTPAVNNLTRGGGRRVFRALELVGRAGLGVNLTVVLTRHNLERLPEFLLACAAQPAVRVINLDLLRPLGRGAGSDLTPEPGQIQAVVPRMLQVLGFINARRWPPLKVREVEQARRRRGGGRRPYCLAAEGRYAAVAPDGRVFPCASLAGDPAWSVGQVGEKGLEASLAAAVEDWGLPAACADCPLHAVCRGGCPARRIAFSGGVGGICELECALRKAINQGMTS